MEHARTDGVEIGTGVDVLAARLLWRHVRRRADHRAGRGELAGRLLQLGDAEVEDLHDVRVRGKRSEKQIVGLDVAMDDPCVVRGGERVQRLRRDVRDAAWGKRALTCDRLAE